MLKGIAVHPEYQGEQLATKLIDHAVAFLHRKGIDSIRVFTKSVNVPIFLQMNMRLLAQTDQAAILEGGPTGLADQLDAIATTIENWTHQLLSQLNLGTVVVNCNPITRGHFHLIEYAAKRHDVVVVFVLEEDQSYFTFKERFALCHLALQELKNVILIPSTKYIVSALTFPSYFLKTVEARDEQHALLDALLFRDHFMSRLNLRKRYIGGETEGVMVLYNATLERILGEGIERISRIEDGSEVISASRVRRLILAGQIETALDLVPEATRSLLRRIAIEKTAR
ncbi:MAG: GNAT family N-acetyltransferase [Bacillus subtilis]|nr:GNAT family N-acetyltransferase [Bacillus subtilis]